VRNICDRILIMKNGRLIETGSQEDIFERPREAYTRELLDAIPRNPNLKTRF
jgi:ABC-type dipeptide/oligopeptide/nickel transport system ATPase component